MCTTTDVSDPIKPSSASLPRMIYQIDETREKILTQARKLFITQGFFETQMTDVAKAAGVSRTSLYRYFQDKADLALVILSTVFQEVIVHTPSPEILDSPLPSVQKVETYLRTVWVNPELNDSYQFLAEFDAYYSGRRIPEGFRARMAGAFDQTWPDLLVALVRQGIDRGELRADLDPVETTVTLVNCVRGLHQRLMLRGPALIEVRENQHGRLVQNLFDWILAGLTARPQKKETP